MLIINWLPWLFGIGLVYGLLFRSGEWNFSQHMIAIGCGAFVGYMTTSVVMYQLQIKNLSVFSNWLIAWACLLLVIAFLIGRLGAINSSKHTLDQAKQTQPALPGPKTRTEFILFVLLLCWLAAAVAFVAHEIALRPAVAWDTVWYWNFYASRWLEWQLNENPTQGSISLGHRHPFALVLVNAWSSFSNKILGIESFLFAPWLAIYLATIMIFSGLAGMIHKRLLAMPIAALLAATAPLLEGQIGLSGYSDYWLAAGFVCSFGILALSNTKKLDTTHLIFSILVLISLAFIKSAGVTYSLGLIAAGGLAVAIVKLKPGWLYLTSGLTTLAGIYLASRGFSFKLFGTRLSYSPESGQVRVDRYRGELNWADWNVVVDNIYSAWVVNASFGILIVAIVLLVFQERLKRQSTLLLSYGLISAIFLTAYMIIAQHISPHFIEYAMPSQDTGLTRFSQIWYFSILAVALVVWQQKMGDNPPHTIWI